MLTVSNFQKKYPGADSPVISIPALELDKGIYWIKGENGSGKTSFIKAMAGLHPFDGTISINGISLQQQRMAYTRMVNYAEAEPVFPSFLTGTELLRFYHHTKGGNIPSLLIQQLGADKFLHQKTGTYSSGMMKKLSLILAFTGQPLLILLDEPLIALDTDAVDILQQQINTCYQNGISFIMTSHQALDENTVPVTAQYIISNHNIAAVRI